MPVKRVELAYGPNSKSKGIATIYFVSSDGASLAMKEMNGILIDTRPIKVRWAHPLKTIPFANNCRLKSLSMQVLLQPYLVPKVSASVWPSQRHNLNPLRTRKLLRVTMATLEVVEEVNVVDVVDAVAARPKRLPRNLTPRWQTTSVVRLLVVSRMLRHLLMEPPTVMLWRRRFWYDDSIPRTQFVANLKLQ